MRLFIASVMGILSTKACPLKLCTAVFIDFFLFKKIQKKKKKNNKVKLHSIKSYKVNKVYKFNLMQFLFKKKNGGGVNMLLPEFIFSQWVLK